MAYFKIELFSNSLRRNVSFDMFLPNDIRADLPPEDSPYTRRGTKTLFLLHGYTGSASSWGMDDLARKYNFAMVMPNGENAFYLDGESTGHQYASFVACELVDYIRRTFGLAKAAEETYIMGISMGGFGAVRTALAYPQVFGKAVGLSPALIIHDIAHMKPGEDNGVANYAYYRECFGDLETVEQRDTNPETLVRSLLAAGKPVPPIYLCCGTEDFLIENNRVFHQFLEANAVPHTYRESPGIHDDVFWAQYKPKAIDWLFRDEL